MTKPDIIISRDDHERLVQLANGLLERRPDMAEELLNELDRARIAETGLVPRDTVQMGAAVEFESDDGHKRRITLVYPGEADIAESKVSILTPVGTALLGLRVGQSIGWVANDGRTHLLTVRAVEQAAVPSRLQRA